MASPSWAASGALPPYEAASGIINNGNNRDSLDRGNEPDGPCPVNGEPPPRYSVLFSEHALHAQTIDEERGDDEIITDNAFGLRRSLDSPASIDALDDDCDYRHWRYVTKPSTKDSFSGILDNVLEWTKEPPRQHMKIYGSHTEVGLAMGSPVRQEGRTVKDFDVTIDLTPYLFPNDHDSIPRRTIHTPDDSMKVRRGTVFRCTASEAKASAPQTAADAGSELTAGAMDDGLPPSLVKWCRRYCEDTSPLRALLLRRRVAGFNYIKVRERMLAAIYRAGYQGTARVTFPVDHDGVKYYNDNRLNRWREQTSLRVACTLTLAVLVTWPCLFLQTKCYDAATVDWHYSWYDGSGRRKYSGIPEEQLCDLWVPAVNEAVRSRKMSGMLASPHLS